MTNRTPPGADIDVALENEIAHAAQRLHTAGTPAERRKWWGKLVELHKKRSPDTVRKMEAKAGLRL